MTFKPKDKMWDWRGFLTADEAQSIKLSDEIKTQIAKLRKRPVMMERAGIMNRAIHRAKYAAGR